MAIHIQTQNFYNVLWQELQRYAIIHYDPYFHC